MDIRKFFGVINVGKKPENETAEKAKKLKEKEEEKSKPKEVKVRNSSPEEDSRQRQVTKKKRIIYDSDSEEEMQLMKKSKKHPIRKQSLKPDKCLKKDPIVYVSETDEEEDFVPKKVPPKPKENGTSASSHLGIAAAPKADPKPKTKTKPISPEKLTPTSVIDYFGTASVQRSEKKLVLSKRKEPSQSRDSTLSDEVIAKQLQLEENTELERQLHEDEEFARTLAMLDETPKKKKPRKDPEDKQEASAVKMSPKESERNKQAHKVKSADLTLNSRNYTAKDQTSTESAGTLPDLHPESSVSKERKDLGNKMPSSKVSSKLAALKQKGENVRKQSETPKVKSVSPKEEKTPKKEKVSPQKSKSVSPEDPEKKRANYQAYRSFLNREGPKALGSKEIPQGGENCLEGLTFVITGVLESIERDEAKSLIERYGGKVTGNISKKTHYLIKGRDCGVSKCEKASALGTKIVDEDGLFELIRTLPGKKSKYEMAAEAEAKKTQPKWGKTPQKAEAEKRKISPAKSEIKAKKKTPSPGKDGTTNSTKKETMEARRGLVFGQKALEKKHATEEAGRPVQETTSKGEAEVLLWVDKYKPTSLKTIIGQQGDRSCANKLLCWLRNWYKNTPEDKRGKLKPGKFGGKDDGASFKAALLSGPPGVGKTTTASLVCEELGLSYVELNASDTRSKNSLKEVVAESLNNTSIKGFCSGASTSVSSKHVLIMDEVVAAQVEILSDQKQLYMSFLGTAITFTYYKVLGIIAALLPGPKSLLPWLERGDCWSKVPEMFKQMAKVLPLERQPLPKSAFFVHFIKVSITIVVRRCKIQQDGYI